MITLENTLVKLEVTIKFFLTMSPFIPAADGIHDFISNFIAYILKRILAEYSFRPRLILLY